MPGMPELTRGQGGDHHTPAAATSHWKTPAPPTPTTGLSWCCRALPRSLGSGNALSSRRSPAPFPACERYGPGQPALAWAPRTATARGDKIPQRLGTVGGFRTIVWYYNLTLEFVIVA
ncbi:unnamed protein product [Coccothraustes coccothraustes]